MHTPSLANRRPLLLAILTLLTATVLAACGTISGSSRTAATVARDAEAAFDTIDSYVMAGEMTMSVISAPDDMGPAGGTGKYNVFFQAPDRMRVVFTENNPDDEDQHQMFPSGSDLLVAEGIVLQRHAGSARWRPADSLVSMSFLWQMTGPGQIVEWLGRLGPDAEVSMAERDKESVLHVRGEWSEGGAFGQPFSPERRMTVEAWIDPEDHFIQEAHSTLTTVQYFTNPNGEPQPYESRMTTHVTFTDYNNGLTIELPDEDEIDRGGIRFGGPIRFGPGPATVDDIGGRLGGPSTPTPHVIVLPGDDGEY